MLLIALFSLTWCLLKWFTMNGFPAEHNKVPVHIKPATLEQNKTHAPSASKEVMVLCGSLWYKYLTSVQGGACYWTIYSEDCSTTREAIRKSTGVYQKLD